MLHNTQYSLVTMAEKPKSKVASLTPLLIEKFKENHVLIDYYADEFDDVRSLVTAIVESVSDITFGNPKIAEFIEKGLLCVSEGKVKIAPNIQVAYP